MLDETRIGGLDGRGDTKTAQLAARFRFATARSEACVVPELQAVLKILSEIAAVVGVYQRRLVRRGTGRDHVAPAQLGWVDAELARRKVHHRLNHIGGLGTASAATGTCHHGV